MSSTPVVVLPTDPTTASSASSWDLNQITNANNNNIAHPPAATTTTTTDPKSAAVTSTDALASHKPVHAPDPSAAAAEMPKFVTATTGRKREVTGNWLPDFSVRGKVIAVTGGARGLGFAMAEGLVEGGAVVYALDILPTPLPAFQSLQNLAPLYGSSLYYLHLDVTSEHSVSSTISHIARTHGRLDGLICSAGILTETNALDCPASTFTKTLDVNTTGVFLCAQAAAREMILRSQKHTSQDQAGEEESSSQLVGGGGSGGRTSGPSIHHHQQQQKGGTILLVASMSASIANRGVDMAAYNASKAAVVGLSRCLAAEWGRAGIRVNCLSPGYVVTKMVEKGLQGREERRREWEDANMLGRLSCPEEYRGVAVFTMSDASSYMTGADLVMDGGHSVW